MMRNENNQITGLRAAGILITLGIVFGDIGTSPLYVIKAIIGERLVSRQLVLGGLSCVFWTLTIITTFKYVYLALNADNNGEGGIFALFALIRKRKVKWPIIITMLGCSSLIADGFITPPISISAAVEGLTILYPDISTVPIVIIILIALFIFQQFGTQIVGKTFGPMMFIWFLMLAIFGLNGVLSNPEVMAAVNPIYAIDLLVNYPQGFWLLGAVFLCTTGAEALYSDLGHCGKSNIRISWTFVKISLLLSYFGQSAWVLGLEGKYIGGQNPFFAIIPPWFLPFSIWIATSAAVIASQALISGTFSLINQAIKLHVWPNMRVNYPTQFRGQVYMPAVNWMLLFGCIAVMLIFQKSSHMEAAYGLAITINMIMTSILLVFLFTSKNKPIFISLGLGILFLLIEGNFLVANLSKLWYGGWFTFLIAGILFFVMYIVYHARRLREKHIKFVDLQNYLELLKDVQKDNTIPKEAGNLVYMTMADSEKKIDQNIIYSIFRKRPKRADIYWFLHIEVLDEPFGAFYSVDTLIPKHCFFIKLKFGFKVGHKVNLMFMKIFNELVENGEVDELSHYKSLKKYKMPADFKFILLESIISVDSEISRIDQFILRLYRILKSISLPAHEEFGLELANVEIEPVPILIARHRRLDLKRIDA